MIKNPDKISCWHNMGIFMLQKHSNTTEDYDITPQEVVIHMRQPGQSIDDILTLEENNDDTVTLEPPCCGLSGWARSDENGGNIEVDETDNATFLDHGKPDETTFLDS